MSETLVQRLLARWGVRVHDVAKGDDLAEQLLTGWNRDAGERCPVPVDGIPCGYFSDWDEALSDPQSLQRRQARHDKHGGRRYQ